MATIPNTKHCTVTDFDRLPLGPPYYQLIDGELVMSPSPSVFHQVVLLRLAQAMQKFAHARAAGDLVLVAPIDVELSANDVLQPDIVFVSEGNRRVITQARIVGTPDLIVEILSPSTAYYDLRVKYATYEAHAVGEYWIVDPLMKTVEVYGLIGGKYELIARASADGSVASRVLNGLTISMPELFADEPPLFAGQPSRS